MALPQSFQENNKKMGGDNRVSQNKTKFFIRSSGFLPRFLQLQYFWDV